MASIVKHLRNVSKKKDKTSKQRRGKGNQKKQRQYRKQKKHLKTPKPYIIFSKLRWYYIHKKSHVWKGTKRIRKKDLEIKNIRAEIKNRRVGLPWWRSGWESACQCRGHGFKPWSGKIPHAAEQLGPWATTTEPARLEPVLRNKRGHDSERPAHRDEEWPPLAATRESPRTETKTQHSQKNN